MRFSVGRFSLANALVLLVLGTSACEKKAEPLPAAPPPAQEEPAETKSPQRAEKPASGPFLTRSQYEPLFPVSFGTFRRKGLKLKRIGASAAEYNGTYTSKAAKLKVIINDQPPKGSTAWEVQVASGGEKIGPYAATAEKKDDKITVMVHVAKRYRVDFKSRQLDEKKLWEFARKFDFGALAKLP